MKHIYVTRPSWSKTFFYRLRLALEAMFLWFPKIDSLILYCCLSNHGVISADPWRSISILSRNSSSGIKVCLMHGVGTTIRTYFARWKTKALLLLFRFSIDNWYMHFLRILIGCSILQCDIPGTYKSSIIKKPWYISFIKNNVYILNLFTTNNNNSDNNDDDNDGD